MEEFVKYDWNEIDYLNLNAAGMDDKNWRVFVKNAHLFPKLKEITLCTNFINI